MSIRPPSQSPIKTSITLVSFILSKKFIIARWKDHEFNYLTFLPRVKEKTKPQKSLFSRSLYTLRLSLILNYKITQDERFLIIDNEYAILIYEISAKIFENPSIFEREIFNHKMLDHKHISSWNKTLCKSTHLDLKQIATIPKRLMNPPQYTHFDLYLNNFVYVTGGQVIHCDLEKLAKCGDLEKSITTIFESESIIEIKFSPGGLLLIQNINNIFVFATRSVAPDVVFATRSVAPDVVFERIYKRKNVARAARKPWSGEVLLIHFDETIGPQNIYGTYLVDFNCGMKTYKSTEIITDFAGFLPSRLSNKVATCIGEGEFFIPNGYEICYFHNYNARNTRKFEIPNPRNFLIYDNEYYCMDKNDIMNGELPVQRRSHNFKKIISFGLAEFDRYRCFKGCLSLWAAFLAGSAIYDPRLLLFIAIFAWY